MEFPIFEISPAGSDIWSRLSELASRVDFEPEFVAKEVDALGAHLITCINWLESVEWESWRRQAQRLLDCLEVTLEGCACLLEDEDIEAACEIWSQARNHALDLNEDMEESPQSFLDITG